LEFIRNKIASRSLSATAQSMGVGPTAVLVMGTVVASTFARRTLPTWNPVCTAPYPTVSVLPVPTGKAGVTSKLNDSPPPRTAMALMVRPGKLKRLLVTMIGIFVLHT
jgi:hypothetical protein